MQKEIGFWAGGIGLITFCLFGMVSCNEIPSQYESFFRLSPEKMEKAIFDYPLDQQIDLMVIGIAESHPPFLYLARLVAKNGEQIVPLLIQRLPTVKDEHQLGAILFCLLEINLEHFEWKGHPKYQALVQQGLAKITDPALREEATRSLVSGAASHTDLKK